MNRAEGEPTHRSADSWEQGWGPWAHQRQEESFQLPGQREHYCTPGSRESAPRGPRAPRLGPRDGPAHPYLSAQPVALHTAASCRKQVRGPESPSIPLVQDTPPCCIPRDWSKSLLLPSPHLRSGEAGFLPILTSCLQCGSSLPPLGLTQQRPVHLSGTTCQNTVRPSQAPGWTLSAPPHCLPGAEGGRTLLCDSVALCLPESSYTLFCPQLQA